jgi:glycosyltransferase involved in cell wall biosynthesis
MIVKNEIEVLKAALDSVVKHIDYWIIGDTGSDDGTQEFIKTYFKEKGIDGELYEDEWKNFAHNRQLVFDRAKSKADYLMTLDADEVLVPVRDNEPLTGKKVPKLPTFKKDLVRTYTFLNPWIYKRAQFFKSTLDWKWAEGLHEYPYCDEPHQEEFASNIAIHTEGGGARGQENDRLLKDIMALQEALKANPSPRNYYNLGMTEQSRGNYGAAIDAYTKCIDSSSWDEESYLAHLSRGQCYSYGGRRS